MLYAQAVAEKGFDIVFQASNQMPTIGDQPCEAVSVSTPELESQLQGELIPDHKPDHHPPFHHQVAPTPIPSYSSNLGKERLHKIPTFPVERKEKPIPTTPTEGCRIPTIVRSSSAPVTDISFNDFLDHPMNYEMPLDELHDTPPLQPMLIEESLDNNKIIPVIGHGTSPSMSMRHKVKNIHHKPFNHHIPVVNKSNIVEVPTVDYLEQTAIPPCSNDLNVEVEPTKEIM